MSGREDGASPAGRRRVSEPAGPRVRTREGEEEAVEMKDGWVASLRREDWRVGRRSDLGKVGPT
jgi:hypothetical protein